MDKVLPEIVVF